MCIFYTCICPLRGVKASHILLSGEGRVYLSGLHSVYSMMREGKRMRTVFDMPHHSPALLPWLSPELLRQVGVMLPLQSEFCTSPAPQIFALPYLA